MLLFSVNRDGVVQASANGPLKRAWLRRCFALVFTFVVGTASAAPRPLPAARFEYEHGYFSQNNSYEGQTATSSQAVRFSQDHREAATAPGLRGTLGLLVVTPHVAIFPRLSVAHVQTSDRTWQMLGQLNDYEVRLHNQLWSFDLGAEAQLWNRIILFETAFGAGYGHSTFTLPAMEVTRHDTATKGGFLVHVATGARAPLRFPVTFGSKLSAESVFWFASWDRWFVSAPSQRISLSVFVELDPFYTERGP